MMSIFAKAMIDQGLSFEEWEQYIIESFKMGHF